MAYCQEELQRLETKRRIHEEMLKMFYSKHCILLTNSMKSAQETTGEIVFLIQLYWLSLIQSTNIYVAEISNCLLKIG